MVKRRIKMKTIGFVISNKENERRRALIPPDLEHITNRKYLYFEKGYGQVLGYMDSDYLNQDVNIVEREVAYGQHIVCSLKTPGSEELELFTKEQTLFGWIHAVQDKEITDFLIEKQMTAIAWEEMFENERHVFWRNNELAGEAGVHHAFMYYGRVPYECRVAVLGSGNVARGAIRVMEKMGAKITVYDRKTISLLSKEIGNYDIIVNAVLWDVFKKDRLIYREDIKRMKKASMIIDISCNKAMEIETSHPSTIEKPIYTVDGIIHYAVDHTSAIFWDSATNSISREVKKYIDDLVEEREGEVLRNATIVKYGKILDGKIVKFQKRS